ncbi:MAG: FeoA family protein [Caldisericum sp.]
MMPVIYAKSGEELELLRITSGRGLVRMLSEMGIYPGVRLRIVSNPGVGPIIVEINGIRFGLGRGIASKLLAIPVK